MDDLLAIQDFFGESQAEKILDRIIDRTRQLKIFPESGSNLRLRNHRKVFKSLIESNYRIIYLIEKNTVHILAIFDTRRDPDELKL